MRTTFVKSVFVSFALAAFLFAAFAMPVAMMGMEHHESMPMTNCPFMFGEQVICAMSVFEHISSWQAMMTAIPPEIVVLVMLVAFVVLGFLRRLFDPPDLLLFRARPLFRFSFTSSFSSLLLGSAISPRAP